MSELTFPLSIEELSSLQRKSFNVAVSAVEIPVDVESQLEGLIDEIKLRTFSEVMGCETNNTLLYLVVRDFPTLTDSNKGQTFQALTDLVRVAIVTKGCDISSKNDLKKIFFYFQQLCIKAEKAASSQNGEAEAIEPNKKSKAKKVSKSKTLNDSYNWSELRSGCLEMLLSIVTCSLSDLFNMGIVQENFLVGFWSYAIKLLEDRPQGIAGTKGQEITARNNCVKIIANTASHFSSPSTSGSYDALTAAMLDSVMKHEHMTAFVSEVCKQAKNGLLTSMIIRDISNMNMNALSATGLKNLGTFLEEFGESNPQSLSQYFPVLVAQLDSPAHQIRSSILHTMGSIVAYIHKAIAKLGGDSGAILEEENQSKVTNNEEQDDEANDEDRTNGNDDNNDKPLNITQLTRLRETILDMLIERTHDVNPYTRAAVLRVWNQLLETGSVPVKRYASVSEVAVDRLLDKNAGVRKNAIALMTVVLDNNPLSGNLDVTVFESQKQELLVMKKLRLAEIKTASGVATAEDGTAAVNEEDDEEFLRSPDVVQDAIIMELRVKLEYCHSVLELSKSIEAGVPKITEMLKSKNNSDIVEALRFFTRAVNFNVKAALTGFKSAFSLIWHQDVAIKEELLKSFKNVYLTDGATENPTPLPSPEIAGNLIKLVQFCDDNEFTSLEKIIGELFAERTEGKSTRATIVDEAVIHSLWQRVVITHKSDTTRRQTMRMSMKAAGVETKEIVTKNITELGATLSVISMIAQNVTGILTASKVKMIVQIGLNPEIFSVGDFSAMKSVMQCLLTLPSLSQAVFENSKYLKSELHGATMEAIPGIVKIIMGEFCSDNETKTRAWFGTCEMAMSALFHIHPTPDKIISRIIHHLYARLSGLSTSAGSSVSKYDGKIQCSVHTLARFIFVLGQTSLSSLIYTELIASFSKKHAVKYGAKESKDDQILDSPAKGKRNRSNAGKEQQVDGVDAMEEEMGTAAAADADHERMLNHIIDQELVIKNLLGKFLPIISFVAANDQGIFNHVLIRETSVLGLCRFMSTSASVCEPLLPLLFTILEKKNTSVHVKTTIIIALGDLAFRFPNSIEPWTEKMYSRLRDDSSEVRYNTLMVVTHLVLNDMIKVKGQVSHVAMSLNDSEESIRELAKLFFIKLSERANNPVYNLLGDIIGIFSQDQSGSTTDVASLASEATTMKALSVKEFQSIMHFLLSFVQKDKQADTLLERLLVRIGLATSTRQKRNIAFCISELTVTEKGIKKMIELFKNIKDALYDSEVFDHIKQTLTRAKKVARGVGGAETKTSIEEFDALLETIRSRANGEEIEAPVATEEGDDGVTDSAAVTDVTEKKKTTRKTATKSTSVKSKKSTKSSNKKKKSQSSDEEDNDIDDEPDFEEEEVVVPAKKSSRKVVAEVDSDQENQAVNNKVNNKKASTKVASKSRRIKCDEDDI